MKQKKLASPYTSEANIYKNLWKLRVIFNKKANLNLKNKNIQLMINVTYKSEIEL